VFPQYGVAMSSENRKLSGQKTGENKKKQQFVATFHAKSVRKMIVSDRLLYSDSFFLCRLTESFVNNHYEITPENTIYKP
jgi:hypothetical protein